MTPSTGNRIRHSILVALCIFSAVEVGCTDVGDNSAGGGADASGSDAESADTSLGADTTTGQDGQASPDATVGDDSSPGEQEEAAVDSTAAEPEAGVDGGTVEEPDAHGEAAAPEAGGPEAGAPEAGAPEAGPLEAGAPEAGGPDAGEAGAPVDGGNEGGGGSQGPAPCTAAGQTNCVKCDQNASDLCTGTEAVIVTRDIEKGLVSGTTLTTASCYECGVNAGILDSDIQGFMFNECEDLTGAAVQQCLNALNCYIGSPQAGTPGVSGTNSGATAAALAADCSGEKPSGVFNCFCGTNEPNVTDCKLGGTVAAGATGGVGVASPNGVCIQQILAGTGATSSTINSTIISDMGNTNLGAGLAAQFLQNAGSNLTSGQACPQCYQ
jgi:hypothetical protein